MIKYINCFLLFARMSQNRIFSDPMNNGPGRILSVALALASMDDIEKEIPKDLEEIHEQAKTTLDNNIVMGGLEQYMIYHALINEEKPFLEDLFQDGLPIFVPSLTTDVVYEYDKISEYEFQLKEKLQPGKKWGVDITSNHSHFGWKLLSHHQDLELRVLEEREKGNYPDANPGRSIIYIPIAPILTFVEYQENTLVNILREDIVQRVNESMDKKDKDLMGSTILTRDFEKPFYEYRPSFYDSDKALKVMRDRGHILQDDKKLLQRHTRYNRIVTSFMYSSILETIPDDLWSGSENKIYVFSTVTSPLYDIMQRAAKRAGKRIHPARIMRNTTFPTMAEAEDSALNILKGYQMDVLLGPASKHINISSFSG